MATKKAQQVLEFARELQTQKTDWSNLHNAIFGHGGKATELFRTQKERSAFAQTREFAEVWEIINSQKRRNGRADESGKFNLRLPVSLHSALKQEAESEGVSLNQLCLAKLSVSL
ncbi:MAG TPA: toxin-antitoxin system HicB family antitoxin, partial [Planctomycetaceae bacterium]|nr:toxin-antitoxin system HicB family antitoxin [Planctomycetaceae bacterium]